MLSLRDLRSRYPDKQYQFETPFAACLDDELVIVTGVLERTAVFSRSEDLRDRQLARLERFTVERAPKVRGNELEIKLGIKLAKSHQTRRANLSAAIDEVFVAAT